VSFIYFHLILYLNQYLFRGINKAGIAKLYGALKQHKFDKNTDNIKVLDIILN